MRWTSPTITSSSDRLAVGTVRASFSDRRVYVAPNRQTARRWTSARDVWAFGCVLYELLTGRRVCGGTITDTLAAVVGARPRVERAAGSHPHGNPPAGWHRCLVKEARDRLRDIGDARSEISEARSALGPPGGARLLAAPWRRWTGGLALAAVAIGGAWSVLLLTTPFAVRVTSLVRPPPASAR